VLAEQREHLASIQSTAHDIKALVNKLPPAEQDKAHDIVTQLSSTLGQQRTMVAQYAEHADVTAKEVADHQVEVDKGLTKLDGDVGDLKSMPAAITDLASKLGDVGTHQQALGGEVEANTAEVEALAKQVDALTKQVAELAARPACAVAAVPPPEHDHGAASASAGGGSAAPSVPTSAPAPTASPAAVPTGSGSAAQTHAAL
jgi:DNA repair ATPase RecN